MSKEEKQIERLKLLPTDYTYTEAKALALRFGYTEFNKGKTSGSRVLLMRQSDGKKIMLHKPHPGDVMKKYAVKDLLEAFERNGDL